jgi:dienelactone hydrolase
MMKRIMAFPEQPAVAAVEQQNVLGQGRIRVGDSHQVIPDWGQQKRFSLDLRYFNHPWYHWANAAQGMVADGLKAKKRFIWTASEPKTPVVVFVVRFFFDAIPSWEGRGYTVPSMFTHPMSKIVLLSSVAAFSQIDVVLAEPQRVGTPVQVAENRGRLAVESGGRPYIAAFAQDTFQAEVRTSLLLIDPFSGEAEQFWYPDKETANGPLFHMLRARSGKIYATIGEMFLEFDLSERKWAVEAPIDGLAMSFVEAPDGKIYFGTYPRSTLWEFDPSTRGLRQVVRLDPEEQYPSFLGADQHGWLYAGIGTGRNNLVAVHPETGERRQFAVETDRKVGQGQVQPGEDGYLYGRVHNSAAYPWRRLENGEMGAVKAASIGFGPRTNAHFNQMVADFPGGGRILECDVPTGKATIVDCDGDRHEVRFSYESNGPRMSSLAQGPDGAIYGSTNHPMHFWKYDPGAEMFLDFGGIPEVGGGNFPNLVAVGNSLVGPTYPSGAVYAFDTTREWNLADAENPNPRPLGAHAEVARPRAVLLLQDGQTVVVSGFPGYGHTGGGMVFYDIEKGTSRVLSSEDLLVGHSAVALLQLEDGTLLAGTSTEAPGGGRRLAQESVLYHMDPRTRAIQAKTTVGADINSLEVLRDGRVVGVTPQTLFFYDPQVREVQSQVDIAAWGRPINHGQSLVRDPDGGVYLVLSKSISRVQPDGRVVQLTKLPQTARAGSVILDGHLYYASGSEIWRYELPANPSLQPTRHEPTHSHPAQSLLETRPNPMEYYSLKELLATNVPPPLLEGIDSPEAWTAKAERIRATWIDYMGGLPERVPLRYEIHSVTEERDHQRIHLSYDTVHGDRVTAYLLVPAGLEESGERRAAVLALHPTNAMGKDSVASSQGRVNRMYGYELVSRGYVVLAPDAMTSGERIFPGLREFRSQPFYDKHPTWSTVGKNLIDHMQGVDLLVSLPYVDADRIGAIGHSFGGYNAYFLSSMDPRIAAIVSSCGFNPLTGSSMPEHWGIRDWYTHFPRFSEDMEKDRVPFDFHEIIALSAPRPFFNYSAQADHIFPDWRPIAEAMVDLYGLYSFHDATDRFVSILGSGGHDFPPATREAAYRFLDRWLEHEPQAFLPLAP